MKRLLIFFSIMIVGAIAYFDAKDRIDELDEVAANTPSQVEMQQTMKNPKQTGVQNQTNNIQPQTSMPNQNLFNKTNQDASKTQNQYNAVQERRNTITNPVQ